MGDDTSSTKSGKNTWSEDEKLCLLYQIVIRSGTIPWDDIKLPEGRTRKACTVLIDKEKQKYKKLLAEQGVDFDTTTPSKQKGKRKAAPAAGEEELVDTPSKNVKGGGKPDSDDGEDEMTGTPPPKKAKRGGGRKKKAAVENGGSDLETEQSAVKGEEDDE